MRKSVSLGLVAILIFSGLTIIPFTSQNVSADSPEVWNQTSGNLASTDANWLDGTKPIAGDNIIFNATSTAACTWDLALAVGSFTIEATYSGVVTQAASFSVTSYSQAAGTLTGSSSYWLTDSGEFTSKTITANTLKLIMTTDGTTMSCAGTTRLISLITNGSVTVGGVSSIIQSTYYINAIGKTFTLSGSTLFNMYYSGALFNNYGIITGTGTFVFYDTNTYGTLGTINCPVNFRNDGGAINFALTGNAVFGSSIYIYSTGSPITLDTTANNYALSATTITIADGGILNARSSSITCSGNWDSSAGTFTKGTSTVHLTGTSKTLKTAGTEFNNLVIESGASYQLLSNVKTEYLWNNGTLDLNGFTMTVNHDQAPSITSSAIVSCHFIDDYYYNVTATDQENETLTYGLTTTWPNAAINTTTGKITNSQPLANGTWSLNVSVTDGNHTIYQSFNLNIWNYAPIFTTFARYQVMVLDNYFYFANATDSEGYTITYNCTITVTWLVWNPTNHSLSGTPFDRDIGYYDVSISAWDGYMTTYQNFTIQIQGALTTKTATFLIYFVFQIILLAIGLIGYFKIPFLLFIEIIGTIIVAIPTILGFETYWSMAIILILINIAMPTIKLANISRK